MPPFSLSGSTELIVTGHGGVPFLSSPRAWACRVRGHGLGAWGLGCSRRRGARWWRSSGCWGHGSWSRVGSLSLFKGAVFQVVAIASAAKANDGARVVNVEFSAVGAFVVFPAFRARVRADADHWGVETVRVCLLGRGDEPRALVHVEVVNAPPLRHFRSSRRWGTGLGAGSANPQW